MKKILITSILCLSIVLSGITSVEAKSSEHTHGTNGKVSAKSIGAGALSLLIWPGLGQMVNNQKTDKVVTHALLGLTGIFRFWSCYDGVVDRNGGTWHNRI